MNYILETSLTNIIEQIKVEYPYNNTMCRNKYNETIKILNDNNIKYTIETDELNLDTILI